MKKSFLLSLLAAVFVLGVSTAPHASSGLEVQLLEVQEVSKHSVLVTLSWTVAVQSDRDWDSCELVVLFLDVQGREIHRISKMLGVKKGRSEFTGHEICETSVWDKTQRYSGRLSCGN